MFALEKPLPEERLQLNIGSLLYVEIPAILATRALRERYPTKP